MQKKEVKIEIQGKEDRDTEIGRKIQMQKKGRKIEAGKGRLRYRGRMTEIKGK
jgi:hypothetical protein